MEVFAPIKLVSEANRSEHWSKKSKRHRIQQWHVQCALINNKAPKDLPCKITMIRQGGRVMDDDNLIYSFKWIRDQIADYLIPGKAKGQADSDPRLSWSYSQKKGSPPGILIILESNILLS